MSERTCMPIPSGAWERFWAKVDAAGDCWDWTGWKTEGGYGMFRLFPQENQRLAHRVVWEMLVGPIPEGHQVDHRCLNRACVNPDHLEPVTGLVNLMRSAARGAINSRKSHCPKGHEYTLENTRIYRDKRHCRACDRARLARRRQRGRAS